MHINFAAALGMLSALLACPIGTPAQNTLINYQGRVTSHGTNFTGAGQFKFALISSTNHHQTATATATLNGQSVSSFTLISGGNGYDAAPVITIFGGGGSGALATATVSGGMIATLNLVSGGAGYTSPPLVIIAPPPDATVYTSYWSNDGTSNAGSEPALAVSVPVNDGLFSVPLGDVALANMIPLAAPLFFQTDLQLQIWFNDGVNGFAMLNPPQKLTVAPYAAFSLTASNLTGALSASQVSGTLTNNTTGTAATATTALNWTGISDYVSSSGALIGTEARHLNRGNLINTQRRLASRLPLRIAYFGDSVAEQPRLGIDNCLIQWLPRNGGVFASGGPYYWFWTNGIGTHTEWGVLDGIWPSRHYNMTTGSEYTYMPIAGGGVSNGVNTTTVELYFWRANGFGTLTVQTQAYGGSWATLASVSGNNSGALTAATTNWFFPTRQANLQVRVQSTGSNILWGVGMWDTNVNTGWRSTRISAPGLALTDYPSNTLQTFLALMQPDLFIVTTKDVPPVETFTNGVYMIEEIMAKVCPNTDVLYVAPEGGVGYPVNFNNMYIQAVVTEALAKSYNRPMFDAFRLFQPTNNFGPFGPDEMFQDGSHLGTKGMLILGSKMAEWIGFATLFQGLGYANLSPGKANLVGGNTFNDTQVNNGAVRNNSTTDFYGIARVRAGSQLQLADPTDSAFTILNRGSAAEVIRLRDTWAGNATLLVISNDPGGTFIENESNAAMLGRYRPWNVWLPTMTRTDSYTLVLSNSCVIFNGLNLTATLPDGTQVGAGKNYIIKNLHASALTVGRTSNQTIDGATIDDSIAQNVAITYTWTDNGWVRIGHYP